MSRIAPLVKAIECSAVFQSALLRFVPSNFCLLFVLGIPKQADLKEKTETVDNGGSFRAIRLWPLYR
jgi:hypothetical protein